MSRRSIRVAISGGGLAGASLIHALLQHPHLDVHIFESATSFRESGVSVGIARNGLSALDLIGPSATACFRRAGALPQKGASFMLAQGDDAPATIGEINVEDHNERLVSSVHRAAFLRELLADVPAARMHASKKLQSIDYDKATGGPLTLVFGDGTTHECDILVGADGIRSTVRRFVLGDDDPAVNPRNTGWRHVITTKAYAAAQASFGKDLVNMENARSYGWTGDGNYLNHTVFLNDGQSPMISLIICSMKEDAQGSGQWRTTMSADEICHEYKDWPPHLKKGIIDLLCDQPEQEAFYMWEHPPARTYVSSPVSSVCVMGDAAHATTPWQGSGAGMAIEDSLIISTLLGHAKSVEQARIALKTYDLVRREHTQRIVRSSRETGIMRTGRGEIGLDLQKQREHLLSRWDFIINFDNKRHCEEALEVMNNLIKENSG